MLKRITMQREEIAATHEYPFSIPAIKTLDQLALDRPVTFFVGENGSGKSTLLEAIADQCGFNPAGGGKNNLYDVHRSQSALSEYIKLSWWPKITKGFFLRAESFYHFASHLDEVREGDRKAYHAYGGSSLHEQSHGESFMSLFSNRFGGNAIYLLDEPEAALSPQRQLAFLRILHDLVLEGGCQFIIATHSPILLGYPDAVIYSFDDDSIQEIQYEETSHYQLTRYFLENREKMLQNLFEEDE